MMGSEHRVILVDDDKFIRDSTAQSLQLEGFNVAVHASGKSALSDFDAESTDAVVSDIMMPGLSGLDLMQRVSDVDPEIPFILITGQGDIATAVQAMRDGAYDFLEKPFAPDDLVEVVRKATEKRRLVRENRALRDELALQNTPGQRIIGRSAATQQLRNQVARLAGTQADILLWGETGSGKDLVARNLHEISRRHNAPFVAINCGALPENIIESELFGHAPGAFTGASKARVGKFAYADGGTIFLDEIESMPLELQVKLLRVLQERVVEPLGSNKLVPIDVRVIAATKSDLREASNQGSFREDLYYRLNVITLNIPPLRERVEDIPLLFHHFAAVAAARHQCDIPALESDELQQLLMNPWPGNVRELKNVAERFILLGSGIHLDGGGEPTAPGHANMTLQERVEWFEKNLIEKALEACGGSINATVEHLGVPRKTLYDKMRKHQLDKSDDDVQVNVLWVNLTHPPDSGG